MKRNYRYRLYPHQGAETALGMALEASRQLYNTALEHRILNYRDRKHGINYYDQANELPLFDDPVFSLLHSQVRQDVLRRLQKSYDAFFRRTYNGEKPGFPRFKGKNRYHSFKYPQATGFAVTPTRKKHAKLRLGGIGNVEMRYHRLIPKNAKIKTCTILRKNRKWYAVISLELPDVSRNNDHGDPLGIDVGLEKFLTDSGGEKVPNPRFYRKGEDKLKKAQRKLAKKTGGKPGEKKSNNYRKQAFNVAKLHEKVANRRKDFQHKTARGIIDQNPLVKVEALRIQNMLKNHKLAKSIADAGWGTFFRILDGKAEEAGGLVLYVNPAGTSQTCLCGAKVPKDLSVRVHVCPECGLVMDRDEVSAKLVKAREGSSRSGTGRIQACGDPGDMTGKPVGVTGSSKQEMFVASRQ